MNECHFWGGDVMESKQARKDVLVSSKIDTINNLQEVLRKEGFMGGGGVGC